MFSPVCARRTGRCWAKQLQWDGWDWWDGCENHLPI